MTHVFIYGNEKVQFYSQWESMQLFYSHFFLSSFLSLSFALALALALVFTLIAMCISAILLLCLTNNFLNLTKQTIQVLKVPNERI